MLAREAGELVHAAAWRSPFAGQGLADAELRTALPFAGWRRVIKGAHGVVQARRWEEVQMRAASMRRLNGQPSLEDLGAQGLGLRALAPLRTLKSEMLRSQPAHGV